MGTEAIEVHVHVPGILNHLIKGGARHKDDPWIASHPMVEEQGCWDYTEWDVAIQQFMAAFGGSESTCLATKS